MRTSAIARLAPNFGVPDATFASIALSRVTIAVASTTMVNVRRASADESHKGLEVDGGVTDGSGLGEVRFIGREGNRIFEFTVKK